MTEKEYINTSDLARIRAIMATIRNIIPENSDIVKRKDYNTVCHHLYKWEQELSKKVNVQ